MSKQTGGYAFPIPNADFQTFQPQTVDEYKRIQSGMTLRDYFAAQAMQALISGYLSNEKSSESGFKFHEGDHVHAAEAAYLVADAMIAERNE